MKISSISSDSMASMHPSLHTQESLFSTLQHTLRSLFMKLDHMGTAIALGEAGDLEGAKALREKNV